MPALKNVKHEKFIQLLVADPNMSQRKAYREAFNNYTSSDTYIDEQACRTFNREDVSNRYKEVTNKIASRLEQKTIVSVEGLLNDLQTIKNNCLIKRKAIIKNEIGEPVEVETDDFIDASAALKAVELMGKHLKMFTDKTESTNVNLNTEMTLEEAEKYLKEVGIKV